MPQAEGHLVLGQFAVAAPEKGFGLFVLLELLLGDFAHDGSWKMMGVVYNRPFLSGKRERPAICRPGLRLSPKQRA
jgi:hypothetical protein